MVHLEDITPHYARTLDEWRRRFFANIDAVRTLGFSDTFIRMWEYYLCYCEGGFAERYIGDVQLILAKPRWRVNLQRSDDAVALSMPK
jgi:cyclopropane-fatty-acyl-phospholipid synthase